MRGPVSTQLSIGCIDFVIAEKKHHHFIKIVLRRSDHLSCVASDAMEVIDSGEARLKALGESLIISAIYTVIACSLLSVRSGGIPGLHGSTPKSKRAARPTCPLHRV